MACGMWLGLRPSSSLTSSPSSVLCVVIHMHVTARTDQLLPSWTRQYESRALLPRAWDPEQVIPPGRWKVGFLVLEGPFLLQSTTAITVHHVRISSPPRQQDSTEMQQGGSVPLARDDSSHQVINTWFYLDVYAALCVYTTPQATHHMLYVTTF